MHCLDTQGVDPTHVVLAGELLEVAHGLLVPFLRDLILLAAAGGRSVNFGRLGRSLDAEMLNLLGKSSKCFWRYSDSLLSPILGEDGILLPSDFTGERR